MGRKILALCEDCGTPYAGFFNSEGEVLVDGGPSCENCGGTALREIDANELETT